MHYYARQKHIWPKFNISCANTLEAERQVEPLRVEARVAFEASYPGRPGLHLTKTINGSTDTSVYPVWVCAKVSNMPKVSLDGTATGSFQGPTPATD